MGILRRLFGRREGREEGDPNALFLYVRCGKCGEKIRVRVDKRHDLMPDYDRGPGDFPEGYVLLRDIIGSKCFQMIRAELSLDRDYHIISQSITGGQFITREEYEAQA